MPLLANCVRRRELSNQNQNQNQNQQGSKSKSKTSISKIAQDPDPASFLLLNFERSFCLLVLPESGRKIQSPIHLCLPPVERHRFFSTALTTTRSPPPPLNSSSPSQLSYLSSVVYISCFQHRKSFHFCSDLQLAAAIPPAGLFFFQQVYLFLIRRIHSLVKHSFYI